MSKILVVDDEKSIQAALSLALADQGHAIDTADDGFEALAYVNEKKYDLVLTDMRMPRMDGMEFIRSLRKWNETMPVVVMTAYATVESTAEIFKAGACDLVTKPFEIGSLSRRLNHFLFPNPPLRLGEVALESQEDAPAGPLMDTVQSLFAVIEAKDEIVHGHSARVACYALVLAKKLQLSESEARDLEIMSLLHDIGKLAIPEPILHKKIALTDNERIIFANHPLVGENILRPLRCLPEAGKVIRHHHERYDGQGYPDRLQGENIPLYSRIIAIADAFDLRLARRPYTTEGQLDTLKDISRDAGIWFDPRLVNVFTDVYREVVMGLGKAGK